MIGKKTKKESNFPITKIIFEETSALKPPKVGFPLSGLPLGHHIHQDSIRWFLTEVP